MNLMFWALMVSMLLVAIALLVYPLLKVRQKSSLAYKESNLKINDEKVKELNLDLQEGRIDQHFYKAARDELDRELLIDIPAENSQTAALHYTNSAKRHPAWALLISVFVPALVLLLYLDLGMHAASEDKVAQNSQQEQQQSQDEQSIEEMADKLEARIAEKGGTAEDWAMLARARKYLGQNELAAKAFVVALENDADNAQLMLENAEVIALNNDRIFTPEAMALVMKAYSLEPENANVLWFTGVAEYQQKNYRQAIAHLTKLLPMVRGEEEVMKSVVMVVAKSREQLIAAGEEIPELEELFGVPAMAKVNSSVSPSPKMPSREASGAPATVLNIAVDVSKEVREKFAASDAIFVYAKAKQGPRMPLAVQRLTLAELPATITLDDSMAMMEGMNLSAFEPLVVSARVTKSGSAITQSGDYIGSLDIEDKTSRQVIKIIIDKAVP